MNFAEQIAVLDGLDLSSISIEDGRIGQDRARVTQYAQKIMPGVTARRNVIDASEGGNYSGGSSYAPGLPLMPSSVGLAGVASGVLPARRHVIDPSYGANYSGGSSYAPGIPLLSSSAGLAQANGYGRAGLGQANGYGRAGLGQADGYGAAGLGNAMGSYVDQDLAGAFNGFEAVRDPGDGRIGQMRASVTQYAQKIMPGVTARRNVIDASEGANYSGGSSYAPGLPLMPSSVGLAGLDDISDLELRTAVARLGARQGFAAKIRAKMQRLAVRKAGSGAVRMYKARVNRAMKRARGARTIAEKQAATADAMKAAIALKNIRRSRAAILQKATVNGVPVTASRPYSPSFSATLWK